MLFRRKSAPPQGLRSIRKQIQAQTREQQLQAKAYEIWEQRGKQGTPEENWNAAIEALKRERSPCGRISRFFQLALQAETQSDALDVIKAGISALGLAATILAGVGLVINYYQGQERLITERFSKSVEQLGSKEMSVRIGSIYALERIARDSPRDHWTVMEVLTAFVRERAPNRQPSSTQKPAPKTIRDTEKLPPPPTDVQSALTAIGRRIVDQDPQTEYLNLQNTNLQGTDLRRANLQRAVLREANLQGADLFEANLQGAVLQTVNLQRANLYRANLQRAFLYGANLQRANLYKANLQEAELIGVNPQGAFLYGANLQGAELRDANLTEVRGWNDTQLGAAKLCRTKFPSGSTLNPDRDCKELKEKGYRL